VNVTNGKLIRLLVDDAPFDVRYGRLIAHERVTHDLEAGAVEHAGRTFAQQTSSAASTTRVRTVVTPTIKG